MNKIKDTHQIKQQTSSEDVLSRVSLLQQNRLCVNVKISA